MSKTLLNCIDDLRLDLKDSGTLWSATELTRSIERAVSDFSRYLPRQMHYDLVLDFDVTDEAVTAPATTSLSAVAAAQTIDVAAGSFLTISAQPDVPRPLIITIVDADNSTYLATFIVRGVDRDGKAQSETFYYARGYSKTLQGKEEFKYVYDIELDQDYGSHAGDTAAVGYGLLTEVGAWVSLANRPIKPGSVKVTNAAGTTTYTENTHYIVDYARGRIKLKVGTTITTGLTLLVDYTKSHIQVDLSTLPDFISFNRAYYPSNTGPPMTPVACDLFGDTLTIEGPQGETQSDMAEDKHITIEYYARHTPPTEAAPGSYRGFLDDTILLAAQGYALIMKARQYEHLAVTHTASMTTELGLTTALHEIVRDELDRAVTYLDTKTNENAYYWLSKITTDIAELRTAIGAAAAGALGKAYTYLGEVDTTDLAGSTPDGAEFALKLGVVLVNTNPLNENAPANYADYSRAWQGIAAARTNAALSYIQEANTRLSNLRSYIEQSGGFVGIANSFLAEAAQRLAEIAEHLVEAGQWASATNLDLAVADRFRAEGMIALEEAKAIWKDPKQYVGDFTITAFSQ